MHDAATVSKPRESREPIRARKPAFPFGSDIPRHWFAASPFATHMANGLNLLFPLGERFFIRSVRRYMSHVEDDPRLRADVRGFIAQEVRHGLEHERFFEVLEGQGYRIEPFLEAYERIAFGFIERVAPEKLGLAVTVALEHFTATMAEAALSKPFLDHAHPVMRDLLRWHAAEEIEHKAVAFDVLRRVDDSYALRIAGLVVATATLMPFWFAAAGYLMRQDRDVSLRALLRDRRRIRQAEDSDRADLKKAFLDYLRRDFHPDDHDNAGLAKTYLAANPGTSSV